MRQRWNVGGRDGVFEETTNTVNIDFDDISIRYQRGRWENWKTAGSLAAFTA